MIIKGKSRHLCIGGKISTETGVAFSGNMKFVGLLRHDGNSL